MRVKLRMSTHGNIGYFNRAKEDWVSYCERMRQYFMENDIATNKKAILLNTCGAETYQLIRSLVTPQKPTEKSLSDIIQLVRVNHTHLHLLLCNVFSSTHTLRRKEKLAEFIADLRKL